MGIPAAERKYCCFIGSAACGGAGCPWPKSCWWSWGGRLEYSLFSYQAGHPGTLSSLMKADFFYLTQMHQWVWANHSPRVLGLITIAVLSGGELVPESSCVSLQKSSLSSLQPQSFFSEDEFKPFSGGLTHHCGRQSTDGEWPYARRPSEFCEKKQRQLHFPTLLLALRLPLLPLEGNLSQELETDFPEQYTGETEVGDARLSLVWSQLFYYVIWKRLVILSRNFIKWSNSFTALIKLV